MSYMGFLVVKTLPVTAFSPFFLVGEGSKQKQSCSLAKLTVAVFSLGVIAPVG